MRWLAGKSSRGRRKKVEKEEEEEEEIDFGFEAFERKDDDAAMEKLKVSKGGEKGLRAKME